jgi:cell wall-associated NlpC family hydrolase
MRCRRLTYVCALVTLLTLSPATAAAKPGTSWAQAELKTVVAAGLMAKAAAARPNDSLTRGELDAIVAGLTHTQAVAAANPSAKVTMAALDSHLVAALGLTDTGRLFTQAGKTAGLAPPSRFGTEAVARLLGLRTNHPAALDKLELSPGEPATHAEAAYSAARMLQLGAFDPAGLQALAESFVLPDLTPWQKSVLTTAVHFIGYPYVWGGESEFQESPFGPQAHGGFDCSGFVWRVYKLQAYTGSAALPLTIKGRTTYQMSGEVPKSKRIPFAKLAPGDVLFFGPKGPSSSSGSIGHTGIYLGAGWMIHSSGQGVAVVAQRLAQLHDRRRGRGGADVRLGASQPDRGCCCHCQRAPSPRLWRKLQLMRPRRALLGVTHQARFDLGPVDVRRLFSASVAYQPRKRRLARIAPAHAGSFAGLASVASGVSSPSSAVKPARLGSCASSASSSRRA